MHLGNLTLQLVSDGRKECAVEEVPRDVVGEDDLGVRLDDDNLLGEFVCHVYHTGDRLLCLLGRELLLEVFDEDQVRDLVDRLEQTETRIHSAREERGNPLALWAVLLTLGEDVGLVEARKFGVPRVLSPDFEDALDTRKTIIEEGA